MAACAHSLHSGKTRAAQPLGKESSTASRKTKQAIALGSRQGAAATKAARGGTRCPSSCPRSTGERHYHPVRRAHVPCDLKNIAAKNGKIADRCQSELPSRVSVSVQTPTAAQRCSTGSRCSTPQKTCLLEAGQQIVGNASTSPNRERSRDKSE